MIDHAAGRRPHRGRTLRLVPTLTAAAAAALLAACNGGSEDLNPVQIRTLSNRADLVSGGDVRAEIVPPSDADLQGLQVMVGGRDVTSAFTIGSDGIARGLITGLADGDNTVTAKARLASEAALVVTNSPRSGPVFSGAQVKPFYCATPTPQPSSGNVPATNASGLSGTPDANCSIPTEYKLYYRTTTAGCSLGLPDPSPSVPPTSTAPPQTGNPPANPCFKTYTAGMAAPGDLATTTTDTGVTVPYIVRVERGTMNRGIYDIAVLHDPAKPWNANAPQTGWNGEVLFNFGASTGQPRRQARPATAWSGSDFHLGRGVMVVANSLTDSSRNSNRVAVTETVMMMKEHIGEQYGPVKFAVGSGCSGGSIISNTTASIFPGLLDGVTTTCTYPDSESTTLEVGDCVQLVEAYQKPQWLALTAGQSQDLINAKKGAINGHPDQSACHAWFNAFGSNGRAGVYNQRVVSNNVTGTVITQPTTVNNCELPNSAVFDPKNPVATADLPRCNAWNFAASIFGRAPGNAGALDTRDNTGVQYGLKALRDGAITAEEFVTLNEVVGGIDRDTEQQAARTTADTAALETAYRAGIVSSGKQLAKTAMIDMRGWDDSNITIPPGANRPGSPIHHVWFSFGLRDRIAQAHGDANNQALWRFARTNLSPPGTMAQDAYVSMDQWLTALKADTSGASIEAKVRAARPASTADFCLLPEDATQSNKITDMAICNANPFLAPSLSPRQVAGGPRSEDVLKCQLKPMARTDYTAGTFTDGQWSRLQAVFTGGVCDWSKPGVGQTVAVSPLTFKAGPGGVPLPAAPTSTPR